MTRGLAGTSPANVQSFLGGIDYPTDKETLVETARSNQAPEEILDLLEQFPDEEYDSPISVMEAYGEVRGSDDDEGAIRRQGMDQQTQDQSITRLNSYLESIQFPMDKRDIVETAAQKNAPADIMKLMDLFPDRRYESLDDLLSAFGRSAHQESDLVNGVNDTTQVGGNAYMQRGAEESFRPESQTGGI